MSAPAPQFLLVVDDNDANRYTIARFLRQAGYEIREARNGREALQIARDHPRLIVLDVQMPDLSGFEVCRQLKADPSTRSIPVLQTSATFTSGAHRAEGLNTGADAYLIPPFESAVVVSTVKALLRAHSAEEAVRLNQRREQLLSDALVRLLSTREPNTALEQICGALQAILPVDLFACHAFGRDEGDFRLLYGCGLTQQELQEIGPNEKALSPVQAGSDIQAARLRAAGYNDFISHPLTAGKKNLGALTVASKQNDRFSAEDLQFLKTLAQYVALALDRARQDSAIRESEERFRLIAGMVPEIVFTATPDGRWDYASERFYESTGLAKSSGQAEDWLAAVHPEDQPELRRRWTAALEETQAVQLQFRLRGADGTWRWHLLRAHPLRDASDQICRWAGCATDIDEQKRLAEVLEATVAHRTAQLSDSMEQLERFSYSVSHDLRTPLRAMKSFAHLLLEDHAENLSSDARDFLERIRNSAERMDALTLDLLAYSRLLKTPSELGPVNLDEVVAEVLALNAGFAGPGLELAVEKPLMAVQGHAGMLAQCVANLLSNATRFARPGVKPAISIRTEAREGHRVRLSISDNGIGIAPEHQQRIFRIFERVGELPQVEGTGIGLAIVSKAVEKMGGACGVNSIHGQGSSFWIDLPAAT